MLRKHALHYGVQWDTYLSAVLWAYRNTPHDSTGEKPSFLMFGVDVRTPTEAAFLPPSQVSATVPSDYRQEVIQALSHARQLAALSIQKAQSRYKSQYDKKTQEFKYHIGDWVFIHFPQEESGRLRKLSRPWHGPYRIVSVSEPDVTVSNIYFPQDKYIQVHATRVRPCPPDLPAGFFWYGGKRLGPGHPPQWVEQLLQSGTSFIPRGEKGNADQLPEIDGNSQSAEAIDGSEDSQPHVAEAQLAEAIDSSQPAEVTESDKESESNEVQDQVNVEDNSEYDFSVLLESNEDNRVKQDHTSSQCHSPSDSRSSIADNQPSGSHRLRRSHRLPQYLQDYELGSSLS